MGLEPRISHSLAARTMAFNIHAMRWETDVLDAAGIDESIFATPAPAGSVVGEIPAATAKQLGLACGCIAVVGGHDQICAAFGAGIIRPGLACDSTGTVECITLCMSRAAVNPKMLKSNFCCSPHVIPGLYTTLAFNFTGGSLLRWFRDNFASAEAEIARKTGRDVYDVMLESASKKPTGLFVLPHFTTSGTPHFDPDAFGAIIGLKFDTGRDQITRAILEGVTLEIRANIELLKQAGAEVSELYAIGGGARSDYWLQLKADVFGRPVTALGVSEAGGLGAAMLAGLALGEYKSPAEAASICVKTKKRYTPDAKNKIYYEGRLKAFRAMYPTLKAWAKNIP
jgi:xylulokinase